MIKQNEPLKIFVTMPESEQMRENASIPWPDPDAIERLFFERIALRLKQDLKNEVTLHVKRDNHLVDVTHNSMFAETRQPPVYIIDLTGNQPHIYFELGIHWSMKDAVTILISQNVTDFKLNTTYAHIIPYSNDPVLLEQAIEESVGTIKKGLVDKKHIDSSPVRLKNDVFVTSNDEIQVYQKKIQLLEGKIKTLTQGQDVLESAKIAKYPEKRMLLYRTAIDTNSTLGNAYLLLAEEQRKQSRFNEALITLQQATSLFPTNAEFYREQGVIYSKTGRFEEAIESFRTAVTLNHKDDQAWSCLGGLLRRIATKSMPYNWDILYEARDSYQKALEVNDRDSYAQGNLARLNLLLSKVDQRCLPLALDGFDTLDILCRLDLKKDPKDYWRWFDRADSYILSGKIEEGYHLYTRAIDLVPLEYRKSELYSVMYPLTNLLLVDAILDDSVKLAVQKVIEVLKL